MARVIANQRNIWGRQNGAEPQRADLWVVDFSLALQGLSGVVVNGTPMTPGSTATPYVPPRLATYHAASVALPELKIRPEQIKRDSRPYQVPSWDDPCEAVRINFILDSFKPGGAVVSPYRSDIYQMLDVWRMVTRAGRGPMSKEFSITLDANYRIDYAFDVRLMLLRPASTPDTDANDLEFSLQLRLVNCWLSTFRLSELSYDGTKVSQLEATFYTEDIRQET
jgi:hypothetical protein